ncbi:GyrI-like domain-containing protein [Clostridium sp.]|uniref:GyrI-like domain-containing protein n=1 Tax=Clostridium sp. TaxID=1506 RepID=UPI003F35700E
MTFDFKKEFKELYRPKSIPQILEVPKANYLAVRGKGNPNDAEGEYAKSIQLLYSIAYTLRMSYKTDYKIEGFFEYVVPPLEGFWWQDNIKGVDYSNKDTFRFISIIRLPDFITKQDFEWAIETATNKKKMDFSKVEFMTYDEGLCVQCMHIGPYDNEPETVEKMHEFLEEKAYSLDITDERYHHEIYISDPRKCDVSKQKTIIRHPIKTL